MREHVRTPTAKRGGDPSPPVTRLSDSPIRERGTPPHAKRVASHHGSVGQSRFRKGETWCATEGAGGGTASMVVAVSGIVSLQTQNPGLIEERGDPGFLRATVVHPQFQLWG